MYLRLSRFVGLAPERADEMVAAFEESDYLDQLAGLSGFEGYLLAADRGRGKITAISLWQTPEDLSASDQVAEAARALRIAAARPARRPLVDRYDVVLGRGMERFEGHLRLSRFSDLAPDAVEATVNAFEQSDYLDQLAELSGFEGYLLAVDREHGKVTAMSMWQTQQDLRASDHAAEEARRLRAEATRPAKEPIVDRYQIMLQR